MLKSSSRSLAILAVALVAACQSVPPPAPAPAPTSAPAPAAEAALQQQEIMDLDQEFYVQALRDLKDGDTETALIALEQLRKDAPEKPYLYTNLGLAYFKLDQAQAAEIAFTEAISRNPDDAVAHNHLGILQRRKGQFQEALREYQRAIEIDSGYATAYLNLGILFDLYLQDLEKALQNYQNYRALNSGDNEQVDGWIVDIERRLKTAES
jgi:tetratricopeptide (TPR) repeat protein